jgi:acyl-CoA thioesterase-1
MVEFKNLQGGYRTAMKYKFRMYHILLILGGIMSAFFTADGKEKQSAQPSPQQSIRPITIVALGDSLTEGYGVQSHQAYPFLLETRLRSEGLPCTVVNAGISGETTSGLLSRIQRIIRQKPDIVILCTGANDGLQRMSASRIRTNITKIVRLFKENQITVVLAGMKMLVNYGPAYTEPYNRIYPEIAAEEGVIFMPFFLEGVAGVREFNLGDDVHPNARGYQKIAAAVYPYAVKAVQQISGK